MVVVCLVMCLHRMVARLVVCVHMMVACLVVCLHTMIAWLSVACLSGCVVMSTATRVHDGEC